MVFWGIRSRTLICLLPHRFLTCRRSPALLSNCSLSARVRNALATSVPEKSSAYNQGPIVSVVSKIVLISGLLSGNSHKPPPEMGRSAGDRDEESSSVELACAMRNRKAIGSDSLRSCWSGRDVPHPRRIQGECGKIVDVCEER